MRSARSRQSWWCRRVDTRDGRYARIVCWNCPEVTPLQEAMNSTFDSPENPGDLLHAMLEGLIVAEISDATAAEKQSEPPTESRRRPGIQSIRASRVSTSGRC